MSAKDIATWFEYGDNYKDPDDHDSESDFFVLPNVQEFTDNDWTEYVKNNLSEMKKLFCWLYVILSTA